MVFNDRWPAIMQVVTCIPREVAAMRYGDVQFTRYDRAAFWSHATASVRRSSDSARVNHLPI